jgi:hypothetical protein
MAKLDRAVAWMRKEFENNPASYTMSSGRNRYNRLDLAQAAIETIGIEDPRDQEAVISMADGIISDRIRADAAAITAATRKSSMTISNYAQNPDKITNPRAVVNSWSTGRWRNHLHQRVLDAMVTMNRGGGVDPDAYTAVMLKHRGDFDRIEANFPMEMARYHTMGDFENNVIERYVRELSAKMLAELQAHAQTGQGAGTNGALSKISPNWM